MTTPRTERMNEDRVQDARMTKARAKHNRAMLMAEWVHKGHVRYASDPTPATLCVRIGDQEFTELKKVFPSSVMITQIALARQAGLSCRRLVEFDPNLMNYHSNDVISFGAPPSGGAKPDLPRQ